MHRQTSDVGNCASKMNYLCSDGTSDPNRSVFYLIVQRSRFDFSVWIQTDTLDNA